MSQRDTQFAGFAKALYDDFIQLRENEDTAIETIDQTYEELWREKAERLIAQRAYDLVQHTIGYSLEYLHECGHGISGSMNSRIQPSIPDMAKLPEVSQ